MIEQIKNEQQTNDRDRNECNINNMANESLVHDTLQWEWYTDRIILSFMTRSNGNGTLLEDSVVID